MHYYYYSQSVLCPAELVSLSRQKEKERKKKERNRERKKERKKERNAYVCMREREAASKRNENMFFFPSFSSSFFYQLFIDV